MGIVYHPQRRDTFELNTEKLENKSVCLDLLWTTTLPRVFNETRISVKQWWSNPRPESICFNLFVSLHSLWGIEQVCELLVNPRIREKEFFNCFLIHKNKHISLIVWFTVKHCSWLPQRCSLLCLELPSLFLLLLLLNSTKHVFWQWLREGSSRQSREHRCGSQLQSFTANYTISNICMFIPMDQTLIKEFIL